MNNIQKLKLNTFTSLINQMVVIASGLILPRFILSYYGSNVNGLVSSITQFLSVISFLELGVGSVVQSALYKPIAIKEDNHINVILASARKFFKNLSKILIVYVVLLIILFPNIINNSIDYLGTSFLIFAMAISLFAQYYFGVVNQIFLNAHQKNYIQLSAQVITVVLNLVVSILLITNGAPIQIVRLGSSIVFLLRPIFLNVYVQKYYDIDYNAEPNKDSIPQKWNGIAQHVAFTVLNSTDMIVLTLFSTLENVSIYSIHNMVVTGLKNLITSTTNGIQSFFGNLLAEEKNDELTSYFNNLEWAIHTLVTFLFGMAAVLLNSFVLIYTNGIDDANYDVPLFALMITIAQANFCLRVPYQAVVLSGGHYRQTQSSSIVEALINIFVSIFTVNHLGLVGVALGTLSAMAYRTIYLVSYLSKNLIYRPVSIFLKQLIVDVTSFVLILSIGELLPLTPINYIEWVIVAFILGIISFFICFVINYISYKENVIHFIRKVFRKESSR